MKIKRLQTLVFSLATTLWCCCSLATSASGQIIPDPIRDVVSITATDPEGAEPERIPPGSLRPIRLDPVVFTVSRKGPIDFDLQVRYTLGGTAQNGVDYAKLTEGLTIPKGSASATIEIIPLDDDLKEIPETVTVTLEEPICPAIFPPPLDCYAVSAESTARGVILDNGAVTGNVPPRIAITQPNSGALFPALSTIEIDATAIDADGYASWVEFFANDKKIGESRLVFVVAPQPGTPLHHQFLWSAVPAGSYTLTALAHDDQGASTTSAPVPIVVGDLPPLPIVTLEVTDAESKEPKTPLPTEKFAIDRGQFTVTRTGPTDAPLTVVYSLSGSAINGLDYERLTGEVVIPAGAASAVIEVLPINDRRLEPTENVIASLMPSPFIIPLDIAIPIVPIRPQYQLGKPASGEIAILDNGESQGSDLPVINIVASDPDATEPPIGNPNTKIKLDSGTFTVSRTGSTANSLHVFVQVGGSAISGQDYAPIERMVTFPPGAETVDVSVIPFFDSLVEGDESVAVELVPTFIILDPTLPVDLTTAPISLPIDLYELGNNRSAKVVIHDNPVIVENFPPKADISSPLPGVVLPAPADIRIEVQTADADGYVPWVEFFSGKEKIGDSRLAFLVAPKPGTIINHEFIWKGVGSGVYVITAIAHDDGGAQTVTGPVTVNVSGANDWPFVTIQATDAESTEPRTASPTTKFAPDHGQFTVTRTGSTTEPLLVYYTLGGSAVNGTDYDLLDGKVTIPAGSASATIDISPINDQILEPTETVVATLVYSLLKAPFNPITPTFPIHPPYYIGSPDSAELKILDNGEGHTAETPVINIVASDREATEPPALDPTGLVKPDNGTFTLTRSGDASKRLSVFVEIRGTATNGEDYEALQSVVFFPAGSASVDVTVTPRMDQWVEGDESVVMELLPAILVGPVTPGRPVIDPVFVPFSPYELGSNTVAKVVIHDNPIIVENGPPKADIVQPLPDSKWTAPADIRITVQTADADGYVPWVEFFSGKDKIGDSRIDFLVAPKPGTVITHDFLWRNVKEGDYVITAVAHDNGGARTTTDPVTVHVGPAQPQTVVTVVATDPEGAEPNPVPPGMGMPIRLDPIVFTITRDGDLTVPIPVYYHLEGTARNGIDYDRLSGRVEIPKGTKSVEVVVSPIDDDLVEGDEPVALVIDPPICIAVAKPQPSCYQVGAAGAAKGIIKDNDPNGSLRPTITITASDAIATEGASTWASPTATFVIHRRGPTNDPVTVGIKVSGTATPGKDYDTLPESVTIPAGERNVKLVLKAIDDQEVEGIETVLVELLPAPLVKFGGWPDYRLGNPYRAVAVILDNDQVRPPCKTLADGRFHLCLPAETGAAYELQVSTDLDVWSSLGPVEATEGAIHYVDPDKATESGRFYRIVPATPDP